MGASFQPRMTVLLQEMSGDIARDILKEKYLVILPISAII